MFDLQNYTQSEISDAFLFDHALPFHLTEQNSEDFVGLEDIWSTILDERVLIKLEEKVEIMRDLILEETRPKGPPNIESASDAGTSSRASQTGKARDLMMLEAPSNIKLIDQTVKSEAQRNLYKQLMKEAKERNKGLKFDLMRANAMAQAGDPSNEARDNTSELGDKLQVAALGGLDATKEAPAGFGAGPTAIPEDGAEDVESLHDGAREGEEEAKQEQNAQDNQPKQHTE